MAIPALIAAGIGAASIAANMYDDYKKREAAEDTYQNISDLANEAVAGNDRDINSYENLLRSTYGDSAAKYNKALADFMNSEVYQNKDFEYGKDVSDFYDPAANQRVAAAMTAINDASASGGNRFSSDYVNQVGAKQQALASEEWEKAYNRLMQDRQTQLSEWQANAQNGWNNYNAQVARDQYGISQYGQAQQNLTSRLGDVTSARMQNRLGGLQSQASVAGAQLNATANQGGIGSVLGPVAQFAGSYFGSGS